MEYNSLNIPSGLVPCYDVKLAKEWGIPIAIFYNFILVKHSYLTQYSCYPGNQIDELGYLQKPSVDLWNYGPNWMFNHGKWIKFDREECSNFTALSPYHQNKSIKILVQQNKIEEKFANEMTERFGDRAFSSLKNYLYLRLAETKDSKKNFTF